MPRQCGPCHDPARNAIDKRLLEMDISRESYRSISQDFAYSEDALRRHKENHLTAQVADVYATMKTAREKALAEVRERELEGTKSAVIEENTARLKASASLLDQLRDLREEAWKILENSKKDPRLALGAIQRLTQLLELQAEVEGKIRAGLLNIAIGQTVSIYSSPEWSRVGALLSEVLGPYPDLRAEVAKRLLELAEEARC